MEHNLEKPSGPLVSADAVGNELGVTGRTVLYWEKRGVITPALRVGKIVRFDLEAVKAQLAQATIAERASQAKGLGGMEPPLGSPPTLLKPQVVQDFNPEPPTSAP